MKPPAANPPTGAVPPKPTNPQAGLGPQMSSQMGAGSGIPVMPTPFGAVGPLPGGAPTGQTAQTQMSAARPRQPTIPPDAMMGGGPQAPVASSQGVTMASQPTGLPSGPIDASWQRIWLRAQGRDWVSLALIGSSPQAPEATMKVAGMLARISEELGHPLVVLDARSVELRTMASIQARMRSLAARGTRAITVLQLPMYNPITVPIAQAADASMICVFVGESRLTNTQQTVEQIGRDRFLGTVILKHP